MRFNPITLKKKSFNGHSFIQYSLLILRSSSSHAAAAWSEMNVNKIE